MLTWLGRVAKGRIAARKSLGPRRALGMESGCKLSELGRKTW